MPNVAVEELAVKMSKMKRPELMKLLRRLNCPFKMDFTDSFLKAMSVERLRHVVLAASLHAHK